ncbi:unnamed protein product [Acanthoscelides obtectus]|uniref:Uncharacterized protein n=1 Tax=Acanthoscelides obtectus TaxID=200917 RepID=A0A9P0LYD2_ACAOB|nr:unnamed protein product [Acanthoscelides obtectus]CAK1655856.1 hypothetical protein AOBTE_LOCUS19394 [Acanthoscelides obtectus]
MQLESSLHANHYL